MSRWFRFEASAIRHPKVTGLSDANKWLWVQLLSVAAENKGQLPNERHLSTVLNRRLDHLLRGLQELSKAGLIDVIDGGYVPHDWDHYQMKSDSSAERVRNWRRKRNVACNVTVTEHDTNTIREDKRTTPNGVVRKNTGTRLPKDWCPSSPGKMLEWAAQQTPSLDKSDVLRELEAFRDYWTGEAKREASKLDWDAAFRTWLRRAKPKRAHGNGTFDARSRRQREILDYCEQLERDNGSEQQGEGNNGIHRSDDTGGFSPNGRLRLVAGGGVGEL
jgi:hypothetical protein